MSTPPDAADRALVDRLDDVWSRLADLGATLSAAEWVRPTAVPGWSVQDNLAHLTDLERMLLGRDPVDHEVPEGLAHLRNDVGSRNEVFVDARRSWSGAEVLAEFVEVTGARLAVLRALGAEGFGAESWTPMGPGTVRDLLPFRAFDSWVHEQDMREALGRPGGCTGPAAEAAMDRIVGTLGFVVGKKVAPPDGTVVVVTTTVPLARTVVLEVAGGRAAPRDEAPANPTVRITMAGDAYARLACGRADPATVPVTLDGDADLGRRILAALNFLF